MTDATQTVQHTLVEPESDLDTQWWWEALGEGRLEVPRCRACGRTFFPPQPNCPYCGSDDWEGIQASGRGKIYSWVVIYTPLDPRFADEVPYAILAVELEEGVRLFGRWRGTLEDIRSGADVQAWIYRVQGSPLLGFEPAPAR
jgi:uncharacterized OB-fold protein